MVLINKIEGLLSKAEKKLEAAENELKELKGKIDELDIGFMEEKWTGAVKKVKVAQRDELMKEKKKCENNEED